MRKISHLLSFLFCAALIGAAHAADLDRAIPAPAIDPPQTQYSEIAVLAGGCYWGQQGLFEHVKGVTRVVAGFSGGSRLTATYAQVARGNTGHAEAVQITFDPHKISYGQLLQIYFSVAFDPTELNRQGPDIGNSYRSEIFYDGPVQEKVARAYVAQLSAAHIFAAPIVTQIEPLKGFYRVGADQQDFLVRHRDNPYIVINDLPKIAALGRVWPQFYRAAPVTLPIEMRSFTLLTPM